jgi:CO/xanthine dehydrogenase Mo-binding subunit
MMGALSFLDQREILSRERRPAGEGARSRSERPRRVIAALDTGHMVNPAILQSQVETGIVYRLTAAPYGVFTIENGRVQQNNFDDYEMLRMADMPTVETVLVPSGGFWRGVGAATGSRAVQRDFHGDRQAHTFAAAKGSGP